MTKEKELQRSIGAFVLLVGCLFLMIFPWFISPLWGFLVDGVILVGLGVLYSIGVYFLHKDGHD